MTGIERYARYAADETHGILDGGTPRVPTAAEFASGVAAPGSDAPLPYGVLYQARWRTLSDGMARHAREVVRALALAGTPVRLSGHHGDQGQIRDETDLESMRDVGHLTEVSFASTLLAIRQLVLHDPRYVENVLAPQGARFATFDVEQRVYRNTVAYTSWERSTVDPELVKRLNRCGQVWVPCKRNRDVFKAAGVRNVYVVPCPYDPSRHAPSQIPYPRGSDEVPDGKRFYAIGKWEPRKGLHELIGAFLHTFGPGDKASLYIKTSLWGQWANYPVNTLDDEDRLICPSLAIWLEDADVRKRWTMDAVRKRVRIDTRLLTEAEIADIHRRNNIYVSASHGEAWDLPAFDAVAAGNGLVHVGYGGSEDYAPEGPHVVRVPHELGPIGHAEYNWEPDAEWAHWGLGDMSEALRRVEPPARRVQPAHLYPRFGAHHVGQRAKLMLLGLLRENGASRELREIFATTGYGA